MGIVHAGAPRNLILALKAEFHLSTFVETGTLKAESALWAAKHFDRVLTIEYSKALYESNLKDLGAVDRVEFRYGDSRAVLAEIVPALTAPALIWLDAHYSGGTTYGESDECPLLQELAPLAMSSAAHFILIDDARLFEGPPPEPHRTEQWPSLPEIFDAIRSGRHQYHIVLHEDVIVAVPAAARRFLSQYLQQENTKAWKTLVEKASRPTRVKAVSMIGEGLRLLAAGAWRKARRALSALAGG